MTPSSPQQDDIVEVVQTQLRNARDAVRAIYNNTDIHLNPTILSVALLIEMHKLREAIERKAK